MSVAVRYPLTIYYDSACPVCASEMTTLAHLDLDSRLVLFDCAHGALDGASRAADLTSADLLARIHAHDADGRWLVGVDVFVAAYDAAGLALLARFFGNARWRPFMDRGYRWIARHRDLLSRLGFQHLFRLVPHRWIRSAALRSTRAGNACSDAGCGFTGAQRDATARPTEDPRGH